MAVSIALSVLSGVQQSKQVKAQAKLEDYKATVARQQAAYDAELKHRENQRLLARNRSAYAASGVRSAGSPLDVGVDMAGVAHEEENRILNQGSLTAWHHYNQARFERARAKNILATTFLEAGSSLLNSAAPLFNNAPVANATGSLSAKGAKLVS